MNTKIVIGATNEKEEKLLCTLELKPKENKVEIWSIPDKDVTDQLEGDLINKWKKNEEVVLPESAIKIDRPLSISESILPDNLKVYKGSDILRRCKTEWPVVVLSYKLHDLYENELGDIKTKVDSMSAFSGDVFDELKGFWNKVQDQIRDRSLLRNHSENLRSSTNEVFDALKKMRSALDKEFRSASAELKKTFMEKLDEIENQVEGGRLNKLFNELKDIQNEFKDSKFTKDDRTQIWNKLDGAFKKVKDKKYGPNASNGGGASDRLQKRYDGLINAMEKMERSINRDKKDLEFQNKRISNGGQLEAQLREAKLAMIKERIRSKDEKLTDMKKTKAELDVKLANLKRKEAKKEAEKEIKSKIAEDIKSAQAARKQDADKLTALGSALTAAKVKPATPTPVVQNAAPDAETKVVEQAIKVEVKEAATVNIEKTSNDSSFAHAIETAIAVDKIDNISVEEE